MKLFALLAALALAVSASNIAHEWESWKATHGKIYASSEEEEMRFNNFLTNLELHKEMEAAEGPGVDYGLNQFSDLTFAEFEELYLQKGVDMRWHEELPMRAPAAESNEAEFDWRDLGAVNPIKNQGQCGSCWAFGVNAALEAAAVVAGMPLMDLSEQQLVDCDPEDGGCRGGLPWIAYDWITGNGGISLQEDYPYTGKDDTCTQDTDKSVVTITEWSQVSEDEDEIARVLQEDGSLCIGIHAGTGLMSYKSGIMKGKFCSKSLNHAVTIVGFGEEGGTPFWIIRNSWGTHWGEDGYFRIQRGKGRCGLNKAVTTIKAGPVE